MRKFIKNFYYICLKLSKIFFWTVALEQVSIVGENDQGIFRHHFCNFHRKCFQHLWSFLLTFICKTWFFSSLCKCSFSCIFLLQMKFSTIIVHQSSRSNIKSWCFTLSVKIEKCSLQIYFLIKIIGVTLVNTII